MLRRFLLFALVGAAALAAHHSNGNTVPVAHAATDVASARAADGPAEPTATERLRDLGGRVGASIAGPVVRSMSRHTLELLEDLDPAIDRAPAHDGKRARDIARRILEADSAAHRHIADGRPIEAIRRAMESKGLIPAVRHVIAEETAFR